jgi:hypothetical protein
MIVQDLFDAALRLIGNLSPGRTANSLEYAACMINANILLDGWSGEELPVYQMAVESLPLSGAASYTMGPSGTLNTVRPVRIISASSKVGTVSMPCKIIKSTEWDEIVDKGVTGNYVEKIFPDGAYPAMNLNVWPLGQTGGYLNISSLKPLAAFVNLTDTLALPPAYERALRYNLAVEFAPEMKVDLNAFPSVVAGAKATKEVLTALNARILIDAEVPAQ